ncbi:hypothetical protein PF008_g16704 [Phytophthora fragariae]|uniref:RxLR effector protein n=1 Tax=Phytophthora fragariae TaxID=53985 RepID=A0A6G0RAX6_9STRA|nr:hypothetical protein PF008_g16704 [Phytophthora fragariae]
MRLSFVLAMSYIVVSTAATDSDQTKIAMMGSPDLVRSFGAEVNDNAAGGRFLRVHEEDEAPSAEERTFNLSELWNKAAARKLAKAIMKDPSTAEQAYAHWERQGYTMETIKNWLKVADPKNKGKYLQIYNGYGFYRYQN